MDNKKSNCFNIITNCIILLMFFLPLAAEKYYVLDGQVNNAMNPDFGGHSATGYQLAFGMSSLKTCKICMLIALVLALINIGFSAYQLYRHRQYALINQLLVILQATFYFVNISSYALWGIVLFVILMINVIQTIYYVYEIQGYGRRKKHVVMLCTITWLVMLLVAGLNII